jgi:hypothetical protein
MLKKLYGQYANVIHSGFEAVEMPEGYFDLIVSNVPFGDYQVSDLRRKPYSDWSIHNYFIARAMDLVRPGGIVAVITSAYFMDGTTKNVRELLARKAKLLGAIRLPARTFSQIASTDVVADIIFLQRRKATEVATAAELQWVETAPLVDSAGSNVVYNGYAKTPYKGNFYWNQTPENVIGTWTQTTRAQGMQVVPMLRKDESLDNILAERIEALPKLIYTADAQAKVVVDLVAVAQTEVLPGAFILEGSKILRQQAFGTVETNLSGARAKRVAGLVNIRDTAIALIAEQSSTNAQDSKLNSLRYKLNVLYDGFVRQHGAIGDRSNRQAMASDPYWPLLLSLELFDESTQKAVKADIFLERTTFSPVAPDKADTAEDALAISVAELGCVDANYMAKLLGREPDGVLAELAQTGRLFIDPQSQKYVPASEYLSGNVRKKLAVA